MGEILAVLTREDFAPTFFDRVHALVDTTGLEEPGAIVLWLQDACSPVASSIEALRQRFERAPVVVACASMRRREVRAALVAGVAGVVLYDALDASLGACLRAVRAGQICVPRQHWQELERPVLSAREKQVLGLVVRGYMNRQIAERLYLAESTVKGHLSSAFEKLGVRSRNEATDLILNPERGLGVGILGVGVEPAGILAATVP